MLLCNYLWFTYRQYLAELSLVYPIVALFTKGTWNFSIESGMNNATRGNTVYPRQTERKWERNRDREVKLVWEKRSKYYRGKKWMRKKNHFFIRGVHRVKRVWLIFYRLALKGFVPKIFRPLLNLIPCTRLVNMIDFIPWVLNEMCRGLGGTGGLFSAQ